jgi:hypothetical protein
MSCESALAIASSRPSAVDSAAARPPAATRPEITYGRPAISGVESTITSVLMTKSCKRTTPPWPAIALAGIDDGLQGCMRLAANRDQAKFAPVEHPRADVGNRVLADEVRIDLELRERRIGRRREVEQEDEEQRPCHRPARFTHRRGGEVAHQDVRQRSGADHQAENDQRRSSSAAIVGEGRDMRLHCRGRKTAPSASAASRAVMSAIACP